MLFASPAVTLYFTEEGESDRNKSILRFKNYFFFSFNINKET